MKPSLVAATILTLTAALPTSSDPEACKMCGHTGKNPTGECHFCGVYRCKTCERYHMGDGEAKCPGAEFGVTL